jgi:hypothetical protein
MDDTVIEPTPVKRQWAMTLANALRAARSTANKATVPESVPLLGGLAPGDLFFGQSPEGAERLAYGERMTSGRGQTLGIRPETLDLAMLLPIPGGGSAPAMAARSGSRAEATIGALRKNVKHLDRGKVAQIVPEAEEDILRSFKSDPRLKGKGTIPRAEAETAIENRARYRAEPQTLPKKPTEMTDQDWIDYGAKHGVDMSQSPMQSLGISDLTTRKEVMVPGGLEGTFTIPDLFRIKANNFDPNALPQDVHSSLMQKFLRTYKREGGHDPVDVFNDLNFALLSPNAPLTQNEFLAQRFRVRNPEELDKLAARVGEPNLGTKMDAESGVGAASRGGLGVKGTANIEHQAMLAKLLREKPEMFKAQDGETLRDVGWRVMNQVPGLSVKTASLGVPWTDLAKANTSAVDLHMIRNNYKRMMEESPDFAERVRGLVNSKARKTPMSEEEAAISVISSHPEWKYRMKGGELNPNVPPELAPDKLAFEPDKFTVASPYYKRIMEYVDESRGANPDIALFPEQWRLWDRYRGRVEPHEMAHPDWRKLPRQSFTELQDALTAHKELGYTGTAPIKDGGDWRRLYYGFTGNAPDVGRVLEREVRGAAISALRKKHQKEEDEK